MPQSNSRRYPQYLASAVLAFSVAVGGSLACACTIPVFRYALERWESDRFLVIVYHDGPLTAEQNTAVTELSQRSSAAGGPLNIEVIRFDLASSSPPNLLDVQPPADRPLPWIEIRSQASATRTLLRWEGPLADAIGQGGLFDSPARTQIIGRILAGDSCVWLLVAPEEQLAKIAEQLQSLLDSVAKGLTLPQGIGLPGSELYSQIPLEIRFSVVPLSHSDPKEQHFLKLLATSAPEWNTDTPYIVPIFGRGRALDVFSYTQPDEPLIRDVGEFLSAACSCRVKQANPGFDLLVSVNWNERLFNGLVPDLRDGDSQPSRPSSAASAPNSPEYLSIPAGDTAPATTTATETQTNEQPAAQATASTAHQAPSLPINSLLILVAVITLVGSGVLAAVVLARR